ncbi:hypothetical protein MPER_09619 [Moniliophthora perniciosa FA553]|nr:hypothetical protein MPER_09619 [Moniliophthora perniciosa FA553]
MANVTYLSAAVSMAGGTLARADLPEDSTITAAPTATFLLVSALLAKIKQNSTYLDSALQTAEFIRGHLVNVNNAVQDVISAKLEDKCATVDVVKPHASGLAIEGLVTLASITKNETIIQLWC